MLNVYGIIHSSIARWMDSMDGCMKWIYHFMNKMSVATATNARQFNIQHSKLVFGHCQWIFHCWLLSNSDLKSSFRPLFSRHSLHLRHVLAHSKCYVFIRYGGSMKLLCWFFHSFRSFLSLLSFWTFFVSPVFVISVNLI